MQRSKGGMVVVSCFPDLFQDTDMDWSESFQLMERGMDKLRSLTEKHDRSRSSRISVWRRCCTARGCVPVVREGGPGGARGDPTGTCASCCRGRRRRSCTGRCRPTRPPWTSSGGGYDGTDRAHVPHDRGSHHPAAGPITGGRCRRTTGWRSTDFPTGCGCTPPPPPYAAFLDPLEGALLSILLEQEKELERCARRPDRMRGWILDCYADEVNNEMVTWVKTVHGHGENRGQEVPPVRST